MSRRELLQETLPDMMAIHREILKKALIKNEKDLTPIEMLQIGKAAWEDMTKDNITRAIQYLERCVELNPDITTAYAVLYEIYVECLRREVFWCGGSFN